jgi:hypothetical protein
VAESKRKKMKLIILLTFSMIYFATGYPTTSMSDDPKMAEATSSLQLGSSVAPTDVMMTTMRAMSEQLNEVVAMNALPTVAAAVEQTTMMSGPGHEMSPTTVKPKVTQNGNSVTTMKPNSVTTISAETTTKSDGISLKLSAFLFSLTALLVSLS